MMLIIGASTPLIACDPETSFISTFSKSSKASTRNMITWVKIAAHSPHKNIKSVLFEARKKSALMPFQGKRILSRCFKLQRSYVSYRNEMER